MKEANDKEGLISTTFISTLRGLNLNSKSVINIMCLTVMNEWKLSYNT